MRFESQFENRVGDKLSKTIGAVLLIGSGFALVESLVEADLTKGGTALVVGGVGLFIFNTSSNIPNQEVENSAPQE